MRLIPVPSHFLSLTSILLTTLATLTLAQTTITHTTTLSPSTTITITGPTSTVLPTNAIATTAGLSPQYTSQPLFHSSLLNSTNYWRYLYQAPFIQFNSTLAAYAQAYSEKCHWQHNPDLVNSRLGENLAKGYADVVGAVDAWGNESMLFDYGSGSGSGSGNGGGNGYTGFSEATGHFTQLVWLATQSVGCGWTACNGENGVGGVLLVCNYYPPGNVVGPQGSENEFFVVNVRRERGGGATGFNSTAAAEGVGSGPSGGGGGGGGGGGVSQSATTAAATVTVSAMAARLVRPGWDVGSRRVEGGPEGFVVLGVLMAAAGVGLGLV